MSIDGSVAPGNSVKMHSTQFPIYSGTLSEFKESLVHCMNIIDSFVFVVCFFFLFPESQRFANEKKAQSEY